MNDKHFPSHSDHTPKFWYPKAEFHTIIFLQNLKIFFFKYQKILTAKYIGCLALHETIMIVVTNTYCEKYMLPSFTCDHNKTRGMCLIQLVANFSHLFNGIEQR
jgi:hypothetical protein